MTYGIPAVIVRPFNNFGPSQHLEKVVPRFITSCLLGEPLTIHGDGSAARDFIYVGDHCEALDLLLHAPFERVSGQVVNLGSGRHREIREIAHWIRDRMKANVPIECIGNRPGQVFRHTCDYSKIERLVGWKPKTSFEEGLDLTIEWYRDKPGLVAHPNVAARHPDHRNLGKSRALLAASAARPSAREYRPALGPAVEQ